MSSKALIPALVLSVCLSTHAIAKLDMTPEQLTKAREIATQLKPPVDFDALLDEADRLGVVCEGNLTIRANIRTCINGVKIGQSKERQAASKERQAKLDEDINASRQRQAKLDEENARLDEENARLDEEYKAKRKELARIVDETKRIADQKLNQ
jgi:hypothetical protein